MVKLKGPSLQNKLAEVQGASRPVPLDNSLISRIWSTQGLLYGQEKQPLCFR